MRLPDSVQVASAIATSNAALVMHDCDSPHSTDRRNESPSTSENPLERGPAGHPAAPWLRSSTPTTTSSIPSGSTTTYLRHLPELHCLLGPDELAPLLPEAGVERTVCVQAHDSEAETDSMLEQAACAI